MGGGGGGRVCVSKPLIEGRSAERGVGMGGGCPPSVC